jgi:hypothetical protein
MFPISKLCKQRLQRRGENEKGEENKENFENKII